MDDKETTVCVDKCKSEEERHPRLKEVMIKASRVMSKYLEEERRRRELIESIELYHRLLIKHILEKRSEEDLGQEE